MSDAIRCAYPEMLALASAQRCMPVLQSTPMQEAISLTVSHERCLDTGIHTHICKKTHTKGTRQPFSCPLVGFRQEGKLRF